MAGRLGRALARPNTFRRCSMLDLVRTRPNLPHLAKSVVCAATLQPVRKLREDARFDVRIDADCFLRARSHDASPRRSVRPRKLRQLGRTAGITEIAHQARDKIITK